MYVIKDRTLIQEGYGIRRRILAIIADRRGIALTHHEHITNLTSVLSDVALNRHFLLCYGSSPQSSMNKHYIRAVEEKRMTNLPINTHLYLAIKCWYIHLF